MELRTLRYFVAVAQELHFGRAARRLHISQPPLSRHIKKLEADLGSVLLRRTQRRVELTRSGELLLEHATLILHQVDEAIATVHRTERGEAGRLEIGYFRGAIYALLPSILKRFRIQAPRVEIGLRELDMEDVYRAVADGAVDVGLLRPPLADASLNTAVLSREHLVAVIASANSLSKKPRLKLSDLAHQPFVMFGPSPSVLGDQIMNACYQAGFQPRVVQQARHPEALIGLVRSDAGVALVAESAALGPGTGVKFRALDGPLPMAEIIMAWRRNNSDPLLRTFLNTARSMVTKNSYRSSVEKKRVFK